MYKFKMSPCLSRGMNSPSNNVLYRSSSFPSVNAGFLVIMVPVKMIFMLGVIMYTRPVGATYNNRRSPSALSVTV